MKIFKDRQSAGKLLAKRLQGHQGVQGTIILGIPRGGVVVAAEIAKELKLPLDIMITRKIGHPNQPELALGAVDPDGEVIGDVGEFGEVVAEELKELKRRETLYRQGRESLNVQNKIIILVDDGIATGATTLSAIRFLKRHKAKKIILAVPMAAREAMEKIVGELGPLRPRLSSTQARSEAREFGEVVVLDTPDYFHAVGQFYQEFLPVSDEEVIKWLKHGR